MSERISFCAGFSVLLSNLMTPGSTSSPTTIPYREIFLEGTGWTASTEDPKRSYTSRSCLVHALSPTIMSSPKRTANP